MISISLPFGIMESFGSRKSILSRVISEADSHFSASLETSTRTLPISPACPFPSRKTHHQILRNRIRSVKALWGARSQILLTETISGPEGRSEKHGSIVKADKNTARNRRFIATSTYGTVSRPIQRNENALSV